jgi:hypothetical protein
MNDEERLDALPPNTLTPTTFVAATDGVLQKFGFRARLFRRGDEVPPIAADQRQTFKYGGEYTDCGEALRGGEDIVIATVLNDGRVIGFGIAEIQGEDGSWEIKIISVDESARRKRGIETTLTIADQQFTVGVAHVLVSQLLQVLPRPIFADATSPGSRYVFKAFGFEHRTDTNNPCLIVLRD